MLAKRFLVAAALVAAAGPPAAHASTDGAAPAQVAVYDGAAEAGIGVGSGGAALGLRDGRTFAVPSEARVATVVLVDDSGGPVAGVAYTGWDGMAPWWRYSHTVCGSPSPFTVFPGGYVTVSVYAGAVSDGAGPCAAAVSAPTRGRIFIRFD